MDTSNHHVEAWSRNTGGYVGWDREKALYQDVQRKREVAEGDGRGEDQARSSGYNDNWTGKRPRR
eukprot:2954999-Pyramimonas_sp.AAC.1